MKTLTEILNTVDKEVLVSYLREIQDMMPQLIYLAKLDVIRHERKGLSGSLAGKDAKEFLEKLQQWGK